MDDEYLTAEEAAEALGVSVNTLYAYVSRKMVRSQKMPGTRASRYWRADVERLRRRERKPASISGELPSDSQITLVSASGPFYRGRSALGLAVGSTLETVAALLWDVDEREAFTAPPGPAYPGFVELDDLLLPGPTVERAIAHLGYLERANPRSYDLTPAGMARTAADVLRWLTAIFLKQKGALSVPIHSQFAESLGLEPPAADLARRTLILCADHGFEHSTYAVRAVASMGVSPWRSVATGLAVGYGRRSRIESRDAVARLVSDITSAADPEDMLTRRLRNGEHIAGFASGIYIDGDPRAAELLRICDAIFHGEVRYARLRRAFNFVVALNGSRPGFELALTVVSTMLDHVSSTAETKLGSALFSVGRSAGWLAHASEQFEAGEAERREAFYKGPMPTIC